VSLSLTLGRNEKLEHHIRTKTHKPIALRFWVESGVNALCGWTQVSLVLYLPSETPFVDPTSDIRADDLSWGSAQMSTMSLYRKSSWQRFQVSMSR